jgi:hypothetical protein
VKLSAVKLIFIAYTAIASNAIKLFIKPNDVSLKSLLFSPGDHGLLRPGGEIEMNLFGLFSHS